MIDLLFSLYRLKDEPRTGWLLRGVERPESVADHSWGTALLCLLYAQRAGLDVERTISIALVHDIAESETGDRPARFGPDGQKAPDSEKARAERSAIDRLFPRGSLELGPIRELWHEYEEGKTREAAFVRDMNLIDMCIQAYLYESGRSLSAHGGRERLPPGGLSEFFASTKGRIATPFGRALFVEISERYSAIDLSGGSSSGGAGTE